LKGKVKQAWGNLTDNELAAVEGNVDQLVGLIERKTGQSREQIEARLEEFSEKLATMADQARATIRKGVDQASETMQAATERITDGARQVSDAARQKYAEAEAIVQQRPAESVAIAFGAGVITGVVLGLMLRSR
jgi:uncharacterized protein YjbJ (UPF0337 family)